MKSVRPLSCCYISSGFFRVRWDQRERNLSSHLDPTEISVKCKDSSILEKQRPSWPDARFCQWGSFHWVIPSMSVTSWYSIIQTNMCVTAVFTVKLLRVLKPTLLSIWHCVCVCVRVLSISHLRLCVDIGSIIDQLFDDFRLASQRGYVQSSVSFLDYMEQPQECVLSSVPPVQPYCLCVRAWLLATIVCTPISMCPSESPRVNHTFVPLVFQLWHPPACTANNVSLPMHKWSPAEARP